MMRYWESEDRLHGHLVDKMLILSAVMAATAVVCSQPRAMSIGWTHRDLIQIGAAGVLIILVLMRKRMSARVKAPLMLTTFMVGGASGLYTLGMLGGAIFFFPVAAVMVALFYSSRVTLAFLAGAIAISALVGMGFSSGVIVAPPNIDTLMTSCSQWFVYVACIGASFAICAATILHYRKAAGMLMAEVHHQRDELTERNAELLAALEDVKKLSGLLAVCASCRKIRDDSGGWSHLEDFVGKHTGARFSHCICPECAKELYPEYSGQDPPCESADE